MRVAAMIWCPFCKKDTLGFDCEIDRVMINTYDMTFFLTHIPCGQVFQIEVKTESFRTIKEGVHIDMQKRMENDYLK